MTFTQFINSKESKTPHYLLIGNPVSHSVSPLMHNTALEYYGMREKYYAVSVSMIEMTSLVSHFNSDLFLGCNITIPHKQNLLNAVDELSTVAKEIGAINTILKRDGKIIGDNTDAFGFLAPLESHLDRLELDRAVVFGSGGATKAIIFALNDLGFEEVIMVSRRPEMHIPSPNSILSSYDSWIDYAEESSLIINATPLGMSPNVEASPVKDNETEILEGKICYDIVYTPRETAFLKQAKIAGGIPIDGLDMLIHQGSKSFSLWTNKEFPVGLIKMKLDDIFPY